MPPLESTFQTADGLTLMGVHNPRPDRRGVVVIVHGYAEHSGRYAALAADLDRAGYECHRFDLRGHGRSEGVRGYVDRFGDYVDDLELFLRQVDAVGGAADSGQADSGRMPRILLGHSLGGLISLAYVLRGSGAFDGYFDGVAVSSPYLHPAMEVPALKAGLAAVVSYIAPKYLAEGEIDSRWLSHDPAVVAAYDRDPLVFKTFNPHWFFASREAQAEVFARAGEIRLPALFLLGGGDRIADPETSGQVFARLGSADKSLEIYPGLFHELFNEVEVERARVVHDLVSWLDARRLSAERPPGAGAPRPAR